MIENNGSGAALTFGVETRRVAVSAAAVMLGSFIFFGVGFAPMASVHNATHDTRHAFSVPCH